VKRIAKVLAVCAFLTAAGVQIRSVWAQAHPLTLDAILKELDTSAADFRGLSADVERTKVTVVVNDHSTESGSLLVRGDKMLLQMTNPNQRTILRTGDSIYIYTPGLKRVEEYSLGKNRDLADEFLLLGFGTSGAQLREGFEIKVTGEDTVAGKKVEELELTPKSAGVKNQISKIQIWLDETTWLPVQQQFFENGSGDYFTVQYSKMLRNPQIPDSQFKPRWPKGIEVVKPQG
jgi:outer membrane lipoprotein-sorting protein